MKTIYLSILLGLLFGVSSTLTAQTHYYNTPQTFIEKEYTYQCDIAPSKMVTLYNKQNQYTYEHYQNKDGSQVSGDVLLGNIALIEKDGWTRQKCDEIANKHFSNQERQRVGSKEYQVIMTIDTTTGKVIEVQFRFQTYDSFATIPVSTYRKIELDLKNSVWFTPTAEGKKLKFLKIGWMQKVKP